MSKMYLTSFLLILMVGSVIPNLDFQDVTITGSACEVKLAIADEKISELTKDVEQLRSEFREMMELYEKEQAVAQRLRESYKEVLSELRQSEADWHNARGELTLYICILLVIISSAFLWWTGPLIWELTRRTMGAMIWFVARLVSLPARLWSYTRARFNVRVVVEEEIPLNPIPSTSYTPEANVPSSPLQPIVEYHKCQFRVYLVDRDYEDSLHYSGQGFWCDITTPVSPQGLFVTAQHVLPGAGKVVLENASDPTKRCVIEQSEWHFLDEYDVAYYIPTQPNTTKLGLRKAKVPKNLLRGVTVVGVSGAKKISFGALKPSQDSANVIYEGSTKGGFSGAPYIAGNTVYGIHLGTTPTQGIGMDMGFLNLKISRTLIKPEATEDWLLDEIEKAHSRGYKIQWKNYGLDDVVIDIDGYDFYMDRADWHAIWIEAQDRLDEVEDFSRKRKVGKGKGGKKQYDYEEEAYHDVDSLPKNVMTPTPAIVSDRGVVNVASVPSPSHVKLPAQSNSQVEESDMPGQTSTVAVSKEVLEDMCKSIQMLSQEVRNLVQGSGSSPGPSSPTKSKKKSKPPSTKTTQ
ncbi:Orf1 [Vespa velutina associated menton virus]|nr:Orf1 [Vespa velutina associated menton virus]